jgi:hypothetical protein
LTTPLAEIDTLPVIVKVNCFVATVFDPSVT